MTLSKYRKKSWSKKRGIHIFFSDTLTVSFSKMRRARELLFRGLIVHQTTIKPRTNSFLAPRMLENDTVKVSIKLKSQFYHFYTQTAKKVKSEYWLWKFPVKLSMTSESRLLNLHAELRSVQYFALYYTHQIDLKWSEANWLALCMCKEMSIYWPCP